MEETLNIFANITHNVQNMGFVWLKKGVRGLLSKSTLFDSLGNEAEFFAGSV
jgi:hypothetical protein